MKVHPSVRHTVIVDSNLLLLLVIGLWNPRAIATHKRLGNYTYADFLELSAFLSTFQTVATTAHVLAEVSNLAGSASGATRQAIFAQLAGLVATLEERVVSAKTAAATAEFNLFGVTDAALSVLAVDMSLLTQDGRLARHLQLKGLSAWTLDQVKIFHRIENGR